MSDQSSQSKSNGPNERMMQRSLLMSKLGGGFEELSLKYPGVFSSDYVDGVENCVSAAAIVPTLAVEVMRPLKHHVPEDVLLALLRTHRRLHEMLVVWLKQYDTAVTAGETVDPDNLISMRLMRADMRVIEQLCVEVASGLLHDQDAEGETVQ